MPASLNDIYKSIGELTGVVRGLAERIDANEKRNVDAIHDADAGRARMHQRLDDLVLRTTHVESDITSVKAKVERIETITNGVEDMTQQAIGAGTLGQWLISIGGWVVSFAAGAAAIYTWLTGRPPP